VTEPGFEQPGSLNEKPTTSLIYCSIYYHMWQSAFMLQPFGIAALNSWYFLSRFYGYITDAAVFLCLQ
jgi:hypothetical protein